MNSPAPANRRLIFTVPDPTSPNWKTIVAELIVPADCMLALAQIIGCDGRNSRVRAINFAILLRRRSFSFSRNKNRYQTKTVSHWLRK